MNHHLLEAVGATVSNILFASSACIYRQQHDDLNRFSENQAVPANPHSTYGWAKILGEVGCRAYHDDTEMNCGMVRIFNAYGTRENLDPESSHVIPSLCRKAIEEQDGGSIELFGDGSQERGFMHAADCTEGMIRALEHKTDSEAVSLGNGKEVVSINDLAETIIDISGKDLIIKHASKPTGTDKCAADTTLMEDALDWHPEIQLEEGVREVYEWAEEKLTSERTMEKTV
jgi:UDP-glucose 4-epimerase